MLLSFIQEIFRWRWLGSSWRPALSWLLNISLLRVSIILISKIVIRTLFSYCGLWWTIILIIECSFGCLWKILLSCLSRINSLWPWFYSACWASSILVNFWDFRSSAIRRCWVAIFIIVMVIVFLKLVTWTFRIRTTAVIWEFDWSSGIEISIVITSVILNVNDLCVRTEWLFWH